MKRREFFQAAGAIVLTPSLLTKTEACKHKKSLSTCTYNPYLFSDLFNSYYHLGYGFSFVALPHNLYESYGNIGKEYAIMHLGKQPMRYKYHPARIWPLHHGRMGDSKVDACKKVYKAVEENCLELVVSCAMFQPLMTPKHEKWDDIETLIVPIESYPCKNAITKQIAYYDFGGKQIVNYLDKPICQVGIAIERSDIPLFVKAVWHPFTTEGISLVWSCPEWPIEAWVAETTYGIMVSDITKIHPILLGV